MVLRSPYRERVERLCEALESGRYSQANGALRVALSTGDGYCCLGVACDVKDMGRWGRVSLRGEESDAHWLYLRVINDEYLSDRGEMNFMPADVSRWYGFPSN